MRTKHLLRAILVLASLAAQPALAQGRGGGAAPANKVANVSPVTQAMLNNPSPNDWLMWRGNYQGWGYSPLNQINKGNVRNLQLAWSYALENYAAGGQAEPLVHDGVIYIRHPNEVLTAHDAATGDLLWTYRRELAPDIEDAEGITAHRGRGLAIFGENIINHSSDGYIYAVNARTGQLAWETLMFSYKETQDEASGAVTLFDGVAVVPINCTSGSSLISCHLSAFDVTTGAPLWKWYTTPEKGDPLNATWGPDPDKFPLGMRHNESPWWTPSVDIQRGNFILGIGSTAPMQPDIVGSPGVWPDRLFHNSTVALDHRTGKVVWWAQHTMDQHNDDSVFDRILVDAPVNPNDPNTTYLGRNPNPRPNETRQLVVGSFSKDGIFYVYDRSNGEFLYARNTAPQNIVLSYDGTTGAYHMNPANRMIADLDRVVMACKENRMVPQGAYSPLTNAYYVPVWAGCAEYSTTSLTPTLDNGYNIRTLRSFVNPESPTFGRPEAINITTGKTLWRLDRQYPLYGMLTTGGGLVFSADTNRRFYALDQETGEVLWQTILNGLSDMAPISYSVNGKQYIAVMSPGGTQVARSHLGRLGIRVPTVGQSMFVFALPD